MFTESVLTIGQTLRDITLNKVDKSPPSQSIYSSKEANDNKQMTCNVTWVIDKGLEE